ncbi:LysE family translocator [Advenella sp. RU8]|uniref:LysE family translocator n=1 Tax=Advenella sp. RU8 TaxID=3399575 RepID=UPI003AAACA2B
MSLSVWLTLFAACWAISISPGPGAVASMSSGLRFGFRLGYWNAIGLAIGLAIQFVISVIGVGALLATSETAFNIIKWAGVLYLIYLGYKQYWSPVAIIRLEETAAQDTPIHQLIMQGILVNIMNPKGAIFLLAVIPQFLDLSKPLPIQYVLIALTLCAVDLVVMAVYTGLAAKVMHVMRNPHHAARMNKFFGLLFIAAALFMAGMGQKLA